MQRRRSFVIALAVLALATFSMAAAWELFTHRLPDPATADREGLLRWMVARDLALESSDTRARLVARLETELRDGVDLSAVDEQVDAQQRERFWSNVDVLLEVWFVRESLEFAATDKTLRVAHVNRRIDDVLNWQFVRDLRLEFRDGSKPGGEMGLIGECQKRVQPWVQRASPEQSRQMKEFLTAVNQALLLRYLTGSLPDPSA